jgi:hypothetical protein
MEQMNDWGSAIYTSLTGALAMLFATLPRIVGAILILVIGWFISNAIAALIASLLRKVQFNSLADRSGLSSFVRNMGLETDASGFLALVVKWFIRLIVLVVAFDALGLPAVSDVLRTFLLWIPNLVVGLLVLVFGGLLANAASGLVRGSTAQAGFGNPDLLAAIAKAAVWAFAIVVAVNQIGIATTLVNTLFMGIVGAVALALGLAFGIGGQDTARQIVADWYAKARQSDPDRLRAAASEASSRVAAANRSDRVPPTVP